MESKDKSASVPVLVAVEFTSLERAIIRGALDALIQIHRRALDKEIDPTMQGYRRDFLKTIDALRMKI